jgi:hypothetical protein
VLFRHHNLSSREFFVFEVFRVNELQHRIPKQERIFAVVKPPRHFIKVSRKMLRRDSMPPSYKLGGGPFLAAPSQGAGADSDCAAEASPVSSRVGVFTPSPPSQTCVTHITDNQAAVRDNEELIGQGRDVPVSRDGPQSRQKGFFRAL